MNEIELKRRELWQVARRYVEVLSLRPNVAGLVVYGSLARGGLTRFSDIDIALICDEPLPSYWVEHRMTYGERMDLLIEPWEPVRTLPERALYSLNEGMGVSGYLMESLLLGGPETVLYDPTGEVTRVKGEVRERVDYAGLARFAASGFFHYLTRERLPELRVLMEEGEASRAAERAGMLARMFGHVLRQLTSVKDPEDASVRLGLDTFAPAFHRLNEIVLPGGEEMEAHYLASRAFLDLFMARVYRPLLERMRRSGIADPEEFEWVGIDSLWWGDRNPRLWELGRAVGEWDYSLDWWGAHAREGRADRALAMDLAGHDAEWYIERWERLTGALARHGHDATTDWARLRVEPEYLRLRADLDRAHEGMTRRAISQKEAAEAVALAERLHGILATGVAFLTPEEIEVQRGAAGG